MAGVPSAASSLGLAAVPGTLASAGSTIGVNGITSAPAGTAGVNPVSTADTGLLQSTVAQILGLQATAAQQTAEGTGLTTQAEGFTAEAQGAGLNAQDYAAQAQGAALTASGYAYGAQAANETATGYTAEATAYGQAANIATNNSTIAGVVGGIQTLQQQRQVLAATSTQRAQVAGNGFLEAGSNVSLLQASVQQGNLGAQQIGLQTALEQGGYAEEASAATAEQTAATAASAAATTTAAADTAAIGFETGIQNTLNAASQTALGIGATYTNQANNTLANAAQYTAAGQLSTANAANETAALSNYLTQTGTNLSPAGTLALGVLAGNPNLPSTLTTNIPTAAAGTTGLALGEASQLSAEGITPNQEETALINSGQAGQAATIASETAGSTLTNTQITPFGTGINSQSGQFTGFTVP